ncbi:MAG: phosphatidylglycerol lysyltransferase, partial [Cryptosporangiaceae bacterium]|nr:phosphatidylglycerol lysyltransferase [Cryptosporangiaceae bacterium]
MTTSLAPGPDAATTPAHGLEIPAVVRPPLSSGWPAWAVWPLKAARAAGRVPVTVAALAALLTLAVATGSFFSGPSTGLVRHIGAGLGPFGHGRWWVLVTSALWCAGLAGYLVCIAVILVALPWAERRIGSARTALILGVTQVLGVASGLVLVQLIGLTGGRWAHHLSGSIAVDPAGVVLGVALAASAAAPVLWRRRVRLVILVALVTLALYSGTLPDLLRLTTGLAGLAVGILVLPRERAVAGPSRPEI